MESRYQTTNGSVINLTVNVYPGSAEMTRKRGEQEGQNYSTGKKIRKGGSSQYFGMESRDIDENPPADARAFSGRAGDNGSVALRARYEEHKKRPKDFFQMHTEPKGIVLIINNRFLGPNQKERRGSQKDVDSLKEVFEKIGGCSISVHYDLSARHMKEKIKREAESGEKPGFYAIFIMSHGAAKLEGEISHDMVVGKSGERMNAKELTDLFRTQRLRDVPVLMFFQMCRGAKYDNGYKYQDVLRVSQDEDDGEGPSVSHTYNQPQYLTQDLEKNLQDMLLKTFPRGSRVKIIGQKDNDDGGDECDAEKEDSGGDELDLNENEYVRNSTNMFVSFSTVEMYSSLRHPTHGSWFIQEICSAFRRMSDTHDIIDIMDEVHCRINGRRSDTAEYQGCVFAARTAHTLGKKKLMFFPGI